MSSYQAPNERNARQWFTLDEFMGRADRVLDSEIARTQDLATAGSVMHLIATVTDGRTDYWLQYEQLREADVDR